MELGDAERSDRVSESWWLTGEKSGVDLGKAKVRRLGQSTRHIAASSRSNFLDMLRAIAICFVVLGHNFHAVIPGSSIGVAVFFAFRRSSEADRRVRSSARTIRGSGWYMIAHAANPRNLPVHRSALRLQRSLRITRVLHALRAADQVGSPHHATVSSLALSCPWCKHHEPPGQSHFKPGS